MYHELISSNLDKIKRITFQALENVVGNNYIYKLGMGHWLGIGGSTLEIFLVFSWNI